MTTPATPPWPIGPVIDGEKYVTQAIATSAWRLTAGDLHALCHGEPIIVRSATIDGCVYFCWADVSWVCAITTMLDRLDVLAADDYPARDRATGGDPS